MIRFLLLVSLAGLTLASQKTFHGYKVLRTQLLTQSQSQALRNLQVTSDYDFWQPARPNGNADIMSDPTKLVRLQNVLKNFNISYTVMMDDVQRTVEESKANFKTTKLEKGRFNWQSYYSHDEINAYFDQLAQDNSFVNTVSIGKTYEGRQMKVLQITKAGDGKPNIWIEAGIHAREWISPAVATYLINELLNGDSDFIDKLNFHILPSANPDGYEFSRNSNRMWRKTRSDTGSFMGCKGVDGNRNFGFHFGESGVSSSKCSDVYPGKKEFSEIESRNIVAYVQKLEPKPIFAHCIHSFSQVWLSPYGYAYNAFPENYKEIKDLAEEAVVALKAVHGTVFNPINSAELYPASGASDDWYKGILGSRFVYTTELRDTGRYGFLLPSNQIVPSGQEMWAAMKVVYAKMVELSQE